MNYQITNLKKQAVENPYDQISSAKKKFEQLDRLRADQVAKKNRITERYKLQSSKCDALIDDYEAQLETLDGTISQLEETICSQTSTGTVVIGRHEASQHEYVLNQTVDELALKFHNLPPVLQSVSSDPAVNAFLVGIMRIC